MAAFMIPVGIWTDMVSLVWFARLVRPSGSPVWSPASSFENLDGQAHCIGLAWTVLSGERLYSSLFLDQPTTYQSLGISERSVQRPAVHDSI